MPLVAALTGATSQKWRDYVLRFDRGRVTATANGYSGSLRMIIILKLTLAAVVASGIALLAL